MIAAESTIADKYRDFPPEFRLALACAHWPQSESSRLEIHRILDKPLNARWFNEIVERNQIVPLAYHSLREALSGVRHAELLRLLRQGALGQAGHSMFQASELVRICEAVSKAGFESIALKGVALSALAYGNITMRSCGDIDLLVAAADVFRVESLLMGLGYKRLDPRAELTPRRLRHYLRYYKHFTYFCEEKGTPLELHWRLFHNTPLLQMDMEVGATVPVAIGSNVVSTLSPVELFLYLCAHGSVHGWPVLKWLADIGVLLSNMTGDDLAAVAAMASERGLMAELQASLILAHSLLGVSVPLAELPSEPNPIVDHIVSMALRLLTANNYCLELNRLPRMGMFFYDLRLRSSWRYRREDLGRSLFLPEDWALVDLPDAFFPLYAAIRPVTWLLRRLQRLTLSIKHPAADQPARSAHS